MNTTTHPPHATAYNTSERPKVPVPRVPLLRYVENPVTDADEEYCLTGYGEISVSQYYEVVSAGQDDQEHRVPRLRHSRPRSRYQTRTTNEPEYFRHLIKATSTDHPAVTSIDFRAFFENLKKAPQTRKQRTLLLRNAPASEAIDARPRSS